MRAVVGLALVGGSLWLLLDLLSGQLPSLSVGGGAAAQQAPVGQATTPTQPGGGRMS